MRKFMIILGVLVAIAWAVKLWAAPWLISSPNDTMADANSSPVYVITWTADDIREYPAEADGSLKADLADLATGDYSITVYCKTVWGRSDSVPFDFVKEVPSSPTDLSLSFE